MWGPLYESTFCLFPYPAEDKKNTPRSAKVGMYCFCNSTFTFVYLGFPIFVYEAYFSDVYDNILLFHGKLAKCLEKPGMVSNISYN